MKHGELIYKVWHWIWIYARLEVSRPRVLLTKGYIHPGAFLRFEVKFTFAGSLPLRSRLSCSSACTTAVGISEPAMDCLGTGAHFPWWNWRICGCSDPALFGLWAYHKSLALGDALLCKRSPRRAWSKENVFALSVPTWLNHRVAINKEKKTAARKLITWNCPFPPFPFPRMVECIICMFPTGQFWYILMQSLLQLWSYHCFLSNTAPQLLCSVAERVSWATS